jgi:hypothetical protein
MLLNPIFIAISLKENCAKDYLSPPLSDYQNLWYTLNISEQNNHYNGISSDISKYNVLPLFRTVSENTYDTSGILLE